MSHTICNGGGAEEIGPIGRLGRWSATQFGPVAAAWIVAAVGIFAPRVGMALSGAGWETTGSASVQARQLIDKNFNGLVSYAQLPRPARRWSRCSSRSR